MSASFGWGAEGAATGATFSGWGTEAGAWRQGRGRDSRRRLRSASAEDRGRTGPAMVVTAIDAREGEGAQASRRYGVVVAARRERPRAGEEQVV